VTNVEIVARRNLFRLLRHKPETLDALDLNKRLAQEYGLTSLDKILFMTAVCEETAVSLMAYTEIEIARLATLQQVIESLHARLQ
jgi:hypothetical protein